MILKHSQNGYFCSNSNGVLLRKRSVKVLCVKAACGFPIVVRTFELREIGGYSVRNGPCIFYWCFL